MVGILHLDHLLVGHTAPHPAHRAPSSWRGAFQGISLPGSPRALDQAFQPQSIQQGTGPVTLQDVQSPPWESLEMERGEQDLSYRREWAGDGKEQEPHPPHPPWVRILDGMDVWFQRSDLNSQDAEEESQEERIQNCWEFLAVSL